MVYACLKHCNKLENTNGSHLITLEMAELAERYRSNHQDFTRLWYWEDRLGRTLLRTVRTQSAMLPDFPRRERPMEEQQLDYNGDSEIARQLKDLAF